MRTEAISAFCFLLSALSFPLQLKEGDDMADDNDIDRDDEDDYDEQIEQMIIENGILLHSLAALLVRKGVLKQEEIDTEMDRLYDEMEKFDEQ
jgi:hypothetical protein